jgi:hypothetical protein
LEHIDVFCRPRTNLQYNLVKQEKEYMGKEEQGKEFTVTDKRSSSRTGGEEHREEDRKPSEKKLFSASLPEIDFSTFLFSISSTALLHFGDIPDPMTDKREKNLPMVKQTIDIIEILKEKTKGNLTPEEGNLIDNILYDLRMRYIRELKQSS